MHPIHILSYIAMVYMGSKLIMPLSMVNYLFSVFNVEPGCSFMSVETSKIIAGACTQCMYTEGGGFDGHFL